MDALERDCTSVLLTRHEPPCLSLYQPTHRAHPEKQQDPIRFRTLLGAWSSIQSFSARIQLPTRAARGSRGLSWRTVLSRISSASITSHSKSET